jgi:hypothetical protein
MRGFDVATKAATKVPTAYADGINRSWAKAMGSMEFASITLPDRWFCACPWLEKTTKKREIREDNFR